MNIKERISKRSAELIIEEIKTKGFSRAAKPKEMQEKVLKYMGIELIIDGYMLKFDR